MLEILISIILLPIAIISIGFTCMFAIGLIASVVNGLTQKRTKLKK